MRAGCGSRALILCKTGSKAELSLMHSETLWDVCDCEDLKILILF
jgi:hypothetical protein